MDTPLVPGSNSSHNTSSDANPSRSSAFTPSHRSQARRPIQRVASAYMSAQTLTYYTPTKRHPIIKTRAAAAMLQVRASPAFLPSTSSPPSSSQAPPPFPLSGKSQRRRGGLVAVPQASRVARRSVMAAAGAAAAAPAAAKLEDADALIDSVETFIFDCDGQSPRRLRLLG